MKLVVCFPGIGYHCDKPLLYYSRKLAACAGYGHFFPVIFSGVSLGYGLAILTGADPVFCVAVCTASTMGAVMRQPVMVVGLLLMCFPLKGIVCMIIAAAIAAGIPLPKPLRK